MLVGAASMFFMWSFTACSMVCIIFIKAFLGLSLCGELCYNTSGFTQKLREMVNRMNEQINEATEVSKSSAETAAAEEKSKEPPKKKNGKFGSRAAAALIVTRELSFQVALYAPLELYFTNVSEFPFDFYTLCPVLLKLFVLIFAAGLAGFGICYVLYDKLFDVALVGAGVVYVIAYVHGMFLAGNLPPLDGTAYSWGDYGKESLISLVICAVIFVLAVLLTRFLHMAKMRKIISGVTAFFTAILLVTLVTVGVQYDGLQKKPQEVITTNNELQMSEEQNMVIFLLDAVDSWTFSALMNDSDPQFADVLEDFTYYPNTVGSYAFTQFSIPYILTGEKFLNQTDFWSYSHEAMKKSPLLNELKEKNYRVSMYEPDLICDTDQMDDFDNVEKAGLRFKSFSGIVKEEIKLVWFKYAPYPVKRFAKVDMSAFSGLVEPRSDSELYSYYNFDVYPDLTENEVTTISDKCFKFFHLEGAHVPFRYDENMNVIDSANGSYDQSVEASVTILKTYLDKLKKAGVYDNTAIVVMADHGYGEHWTDGLKGRSNPLLAVKGIGESHDMQISQAPISYEDLQDAFHMLLNGSNSTEVFTAQEGDTRVRTFMYYHYLKEDHMEEYEQTGDAWDENALVPTGRVFEAGQGLVTDDANASPSPSPSAKH